MQLNISKKIFTGLVLSCFASMASANDAIGGVSLGATRVIYPEDAKQISLPIINHSKKDRYLINAWVENKAEQKSKDFLLTPPLFVAEANTENTLRVINVEAQLPTDRESVYWINVKAIPSIDKATLTDKNVLQLAVLSRIKLFVRPKSLSTTPEMALQKIIITQTGNAVVVDNPSPYHITFVNLSLDNEKIENIMVDPMAKTKIVNKAGKKLSYQTVNDFGGLTPVVELNLN
ncbi:fimbrial chaperone protein [Acinetobacter calcoaceticus]|uniref:Fimbrial chaperone protein n=1 Tax=Acinetobacter calcoaceticus TaxID=471 RepID=A0A4R1XQ60_ACICA|nr:fimbrial chaperone protein [Acinetobacter calcoaceticus]